MTVTSPSRPGPLRSLSNAHRNLVFLQNHPVTFAFTPKVACSSIKLALYEIDTGKPWVNVDTAEGKRLHIHNGWHGASRPKEPAWRRYNFIFTVVRDPVERAISAYANRVLFHSDLAKGLDPEIAQRHGLNTRPSLAEFMDKFGRYRAASSYIRYHTGRQVASIGIDLNRYSRVFSFAELNQIPKALEEITGKLVPLPHAQKSREKFSASDLSTAQLQKLTDFYRPDYELLKDYYQPLV